MSYLEDQQFFEVSKMGIVGMSQGGMIAPLVASKSTDVEYLVNVVGGVAPIEPTANFVYKNPLIIAGYRLSE